MSTSAQPKLTVSLEFPPLHVSPSLVLFLHYCCQSLHLRENVPEDRVKSQKSGTCFQKSISLIFHSEIPHNELTNVVYVCSDLLLFARKFTETVQDAYRYKIADISKLSNNTRTSLPKYAIASLLFFK